MKRRAVSRSTCPAFKKPMHKSTAPWLSFDWSHMSQLDWFLSIIADSTIRIEEGLLCKNASSLGCLLTELAGRYGVPRGSGSASAFGGVQVSRTHLHLYSLLFSLSELVGGPMRRVLTAYREEVHSLCQVIASCCMYEMQRTIQMMPCR